MVKELQIFDIKLFSLRLFRHENTFMLKFIRIFDVNIISWRLIRHV